MSVRNMVGDVLFGYDAGRLMRQWMGLVSEDETVRGFTDGGSQL